jgi:hypothetical protein
LYNEEVHNWYSSNIIRMIKSRGTKLSQHVARRGDRGIYVIFAKTEESGIDKRIILNGT